VTFVLYGSEIIFLCGKNIYYKGLKTNWPRKHLNLKWQKQKLWILH